MSKIPRSMMNEPTRIPDMNQHMISEGVRKLNIFLIADRLFQEGKELYSKDEILGFIVENYDSVLPRFMDTLSHKSALLHIAGNEFSEFGPGYAAKAKNLTASTLERVCRAVPKQHIKEYIDEAEAAAVIQARRMIESKLAAIPDNTPGKLESTAHVRAWQGAEEAPFTRLLASTAKAFADPVTQFQDDLKGRKYHGAVIPEEEVIRQAGSLRYAD